LRSLGVFGLSLVGTILLGGLFFWHAQSSVEGVQRFLSLFAMEYGAGHYIPLWPLGIPCAVPLLTLLTFCILSLAWRVPMSVGVIRGLRGSAVPVACALLLAYSVLIPLTLRQESLVEAGLQHTLQYEGQYAAELSGKKWPGPQQFHHPLR